MKRAYFNLIVSVLLLLVLFLVGCKATFSDSWVQNVESQSKQLRSLKVESLEGVYVFQVYPEEVFVKGEQSFELKADRELQKTFVAQFNVLVLDESRKVYYRPHAIDNLRKEDNNGSSAEKVSFNLIETVLPDTIDIYSSGRQNYIHDLYGVWKTTDFKGCVLKLSLQPSYSSKKDSVIWFFEAVKTHLSDTNQYLKLKYVDGARSIYPTVRFFGKNRRLYEADAIFSFPIIFKKKPGLKIPLVGGDNPDQVSLDRKKEKMSNVIKKN